MQLFLHYKFTVAGTYNYDCSVGSHASAGMVGSVIVNAQSNPALSIQGAYGFNTHPKSYIQMMVRQFIS